MRAQVCRHWLEPGTPKLQFTVRLACLACFLPMVALAKAQFAGTYSGTFSGDAYGTWNGVFDSAGSPQGARATSPRRPGVSGGKLPDKEHRAHADVGACLKPAGIHAACKPRGVKSYGMAPGLHFPVNKRGDLSAENVVHIQRHGAAPLEFVGD